MLNRLSSVNVNKALPRFWVASEHLKNEREVTLIVDLANMKMLACGLFDRLI